MTISCTNQLNSIINAPKNIIDYLKEMISVEFSRGVNEVPTPSGDFRCNTRDKLIVCADLPNYAVSGKAGVE